MSNYLLTYICSVSKLKVDKQKGRKMKINEKIRYLRKNVLHLNLKGFHARLADIFGDKALTYYSLCRIEKGHREALRIKSLYQISTGLGISLKKLKEDTEEEYSKLVNIIRSKDKAHNKYIYNEKAMAEIISPRDLAFLAMELTLLAGGATKEEQDLIENGKAEKLIIVTKGSLTVYAGGETHSLKKGDSISFASSVPHHYENPSSSDKTKCLVIQNPKAY